MKLAVAVILALAVASAAGNKFNPKNKTGCACSAACDTRRPNEGGCKEAIPACARNIKSFGRYNISVLADNGIYRVKDLLGSPATATTRRDSVAILCERRYRGTLLRHAMQFSSTVDGKSLRSLPDDALERLVASRGDDHTPGHYASSGLTGPSGLTFGSWSDMHREFVDALLSRQKTCPRAGDNELLVTMRLGDQNAEAALLEKSIRSYLKEHADVERVQISCVMHFHRSSAARPGDVLAYERSKVLASHKHVAELVHRLEHRNITVGVSSVPVADEDLCRYVFSRHFTGIEGRGFYELVSGLRHDVKELRRDPRWRNPAYSGASTAQEVHPNVRLTQTAEDSTMATGYGGATARASDAGYQSGTLTVVEAPHTMYAMPADAAFPTGRMTHVHRGDALDARADPRFRDCRTRDIGAADVHGLLQPYVTVCPLDKSSPGPPPRPPKSVSLAVCLPPLYDRVSRGHLSRFWSYHKALGASLLQLYTTEPLTNVSWLEPPVNQIVVPWANDGKAWARSQAWAINDCIQRSASMGYTHALSCDFDEFVVVSKKMRSQNTSLRAILRADIDVFQLRPLTWYEGASPGKHITRTASVWIAPIHPAGRFACFESKDPDGRCGKVTPWPLALQHKRLHSSKGSHFREYGDTVRSGVKRPLRLID